MKRAIIAFCLLVFLSSFSVFAQTERRGTIMGTLGLGGGFSVITETEPQFTFIFDVNFISKTGFTLCLTNFAGIHTTGITQSMMFGAGYTFKRDIWYIGGTLMVAPTFTDVLLGGKINGGYFLTDDIGITGIITFRRTAGIASSVTMFDVFAGVSIRFF